MLEAGDYHDEADFDGLELSAYQSMYLNGGPFPTAEGQVSIVAGSGRRRRHGDQLDQLPAHARPRPRASGRASTGSRASTVGLRRPPGRGLRAPRRQRRLQRPQRPPPAPAGGAARSSATTSARSPATPTPRRYDPETAAYMGFGDQSGSKQSTAKTYLVDAAGARRRDPRRGPRASADPGRERPRRRGRGEWTDPQRPRRTARRPRLTVTRTGRRRRLRRRSSRRRCCCARGSAGRPSASTCACTRPSRVTGYYDEPQNWMWGPPQAALSHQFADIGDGYGFLIESAQATTGPLRRRDALALRRRPQAADARVGPRGAC